MRRVLLLALLQSLALGSLTAPAVVGLSVQLGRMLGADRAPDALALTISAGGVSAMIASPLLGWLVDRLHRRGGRRPWLIGGALVGLGALALLAAAPSPLWIVIAWMLAQAAYNSCFAALNSLVSLGLDARTRTRASGVFAAASFIGTLPGLAIAALFPEDLIVMTLAVPAVTAVTILALASRIDRRLGRVEADPASPLRGRRDDQVLRALRSPAYLAVLLSRFLLSAELTGGLLFALYLFSSRWELPEETAVRLVSLSTLLGAIGLSGAALAVSLTPLTRLGEPRLLTAAFALLAVAMLGRGFTTSIPVFIAATALAGIAIGLGITAGRSLTHALFPPDRSAFALGLLGTANMIGATITPVVAGALLRLGTGLGLLDRYAGFYLLLTIPILAALGLLPLLTRRAAPAADPVGSAR